jgi:hypothetical protein
MSLFLSNLPPSVSAILIIIVPSIAAMCGPILIRRRISLARLATNNEIAGFNFGVIGVIYAVLLAFAVIVVWERFSDAETAVIQEAGAAVTIYRLTAAPTGEAVATRGALENYLHQAIEKDWPQMAREKESGEANQALNGLYSAAARLAASTSVPPAVLTDLFKQLDVITQPRRIRLHLATGIVPAILWVGLFGDALLTVGFTFFFGTESLAAQTLMTGILSIVVFTGLFVIVAIDHPFTGSVHIGSEPLQLALHDFRRR